MKKAALKINSLIARSGFNQIKILEMMCVTQTRITHVSHTI